MRYTCPQFVRPLLSTDSAQVLDHSLQRQDLELDRFIEAQNNILTARYTPLPVFSRQIQYVLLPSILPPIHMTVVITDVHKIPMTGQEVSMPFRGVDPRLNAVYGRPERRSVRQQERRAERVRLSRFQSDERAVKTTTQRVTPSQWRDEVVMQRQFHACVLIPTHEISTLLRGMHVEDVLPGEDGDRLGGIRDCGDGQLYWLP